LRPLLKLIYRAFAAFGAFFLGKTNDIPQFKERGPSNIYRRIEYLQKEHPLDPDVQDFCSEVSEMLKILASQNELDAGAFLNFCDRIFDWHIDMYEVESMLWEVNQRHSTADTVNRKGYELTRFFSLLEKRVATFNPLDHESKVVRSVIEKLSRLQGKDELEQTQSFCTETLDLFPRLNNNEKIPIEALREFMLKHAPFSSFYYEMEILLNAPDPKELRALDAFPRIFFVRKLLERLLADWYIKDRIEMGALFPKRMPEVEEGKVLKEEDVEEMLNQIKKANDQKAMKYMMGFCHDRPHLLKEARLMYACNLKLTREDLSGVSSRSRINKLRWLWSSWYIDFLHKVEEEFGVEKQDQ